MVGEQGEAESTRDRIIKEFGLDLSKPEDQKTLEKLLQASVTTAGQVPSDRQKNQSPGYVDITPYVHKPTRRKLGG